MPTSITIGSGKDYETAQLAVDALSGSDQGGTVVADCFGDCGATLSLSGVFSNPWVFQTSGVTYDFTAGTEDLLATLNRVTKTTSSHITIQDIKITTGNNFAVALTLSADNAIIQRYRLIAGASAAGRSVTTVQPNTFLRNFVESGGTDTSSVGFGDGCNVNNPVVFGASDKGVEGAGSVGVHFITDMLSFGNVGQDIEASVFTVATSATQDVSGGTLSGYTSAELVDFAGRDYRTKSTSFLATAGTGGSFIGCALESGGGEVTVTDTSNNSESLSNFDSIQIGEFSFDVKVETNINGQYLATNINGVYYSTNLNG